MERVTGLEPATPTLATSGSTILPLQACDLAYPFERTLQVVGAKVGIRSWPCRRFPALCPCRVRHVRSFRPARCPGLVLLYGFPLVRPLSSTPSAVRDASRVLFEGFSGTMGLSDFPPPYIAVVLLRFTARTPAPFSLSGASRRDLPVPARETCIRARGLRPRGVGPGARDSAPGPCCLPLDARASAPRSWLFAAQYPCPHTPCQRFADALRSTRA